MRRRTAAGHSLNNNRNWTSLLQIVIEPFYILGSKHGAIKGQQQQQAIHLNVAYHHCCSI